MNKAKVLIVDDEIDFTQPLTERLEARGLDVETANSGIEAIDKVNDTFFDAVFLDIAMPGLDGFQTLKILLERNPDLQVILLTGYGSVEGSVKAMKLGAKDFLEKPIDINKLMQKINEASTEKVLIVQQKEEEKIKDLLQTRGW